MKSKTKPIVRLLALLLAILTVLPMALFSAAAAPLSFGTQRFDSLTADKVLSTSDGFSAVPPISSVRAESNGQNKYAHIPFVGGEAPSGSSNWDKSLRVCHNAISSGTNFTVEISYRPHYGGKGTPTVETQFYKYGFTDNGVAFNGIFFNLFVIDLKSGVIKNGGTLAQGAQGLILDEWNTVKMVFQTTEGKFELYVNNKLYSVKENFSGVDSDWAQHTNQKDISVPADMLIVAKCNKNAGAYTAIEGEDTSYVDVDNVKIYETSDFEVVLDGETVPVGESGILDISKPGKKLAWATVTNADGSSFTTNDTQISVENGAVVTTNYIDLSSASEAEVRLVSPEGVRFVSHLSFADYEFLKDSDEVEELRFGTLIVPADYTASLLSFNKETLKDLLHLDVPVADGQWYEADAEAGVYSFAGSVVNVKRENWNRKFMGVGYIDIVMKDGTVHTVYAEDNIDELPCNSICAASTAAIGSGELTQEQTAVLQKYTDADEGKWMEIYKTDLKGLNILAMGDSLFSGTSVTNPPCVGTDQWINRLGLECSWNLTNLGVAGMTVSYTDKNPGHKESIYDSLYNRRDTLQYYWGTGSSKYFNIGNISGNPEDVEMILLEGGNNDFGTDIAAAQGAWGEKDPATFMGAWQLIVDRLLVEYPNAKIVFVTPWEFGEKPRTYYTRQIITMYENYSEDEVYGDRFYLIDAGKKEISGVDMTDMAWRAKYAYDGFHLNKEGMELMAYRMLPLIWDIAMDGAQ